jgi:hypothetical protein
MKKLACCLLIAFRASAAEPPPPPSTGHARPNTRTVRLRLLSDDGRVELRTGGEQLVCKAPCDAPVPVSKADTFKLEGPGMLDSDAFAFEPGDTEVTLRVRPGSRARRIAGITLTSAGGGILGTSALIFVLLGVASANSDSRVHQPVAAARGRELFIEPEKPYGGPGPWIVLGTGAVSLVTGLVLLAGSHATTFERE